MEQLPDIEDIAYAHPLKVREFLGGKSGVVFGDFKSDPDTRLGPSWYFTQVTPFQVHLKLGHFDSQAWITRLDNGEYVEGAKLEIILDSTKNLLTNRDIQAKAVSNKYGLAKLPGIEKLDPKLKTINNWDLQKPIFFLRVEKAGDLAYLPIFHEFKTFPRNTYMRKRFQHIRAWGTTAQGVYRAGEDVQYKIYVRNQDGTGLVPAPKKTYSLRIKDPLGKSIYKEENILLNEFGSIFGELSLPQNAVAGWYHFELSSDFLESSWYPMRVLVTDFSPAPFRVSSELNGEQFTEKDKITVNTSAKLHAGGPYANAAVRVSARLEQINFSTNNPKIKDFSFQANDKWRNWETIHIVKEKIDKNGEHKTTFSIKPEQSVNYGKLVIESAVRDDRGKYISSLSSGIFYGRDRFVGLKIDQWLFEKGEPQKVFAVVVDETDELQSGVKIQIKIERKKVKASRVKGAGNAYLTKYITEWVKESECNLRSENEAVSCEFTPQKIGSYRVSASIEDTKGKEQFSSIYRYSTGDGTTFWETNTQNVLELNIDKTDYKIGDTARILVKNPYPGAKALISIERYGVLEAYTKTFHNSSEVIEIPIKEDFLPRVYVSVLVTSERVDKSPSEGGIDLGKPTFKLGYAEINIKDPYKTLDVTVQPSREKYKPGDEIQVDFSVQAKNKEFLETELAVIVLDEAVVDLIIDGKDYFDLYKGLYKADARDVHNYNLLKQLVGKRAFEKKGANPGGGGGQSTSTSQKSRDIFKYVSYWGPSIKTDKNGKASISFKAPDNLTGWRVFALAASKSEHLGLGEGKFFVNKDIEIRPALPNRVTEGDKFIARFSVMNRSKKDRKLNVSLLASGPIKDSNEVKLKIDAPAYERQIVSIPVETEGKGEVSFTVKAYDEQEEDSIIKKVPVEIRAALETVSIYSSSTEKITREAISFPPDIREDIGELRVRASASIIASLEGVFKYLKNYPYVCWEQQMTKAVAASQYLALKKYLNKDFRWDEADQLVKNTLAKASIYQAANGGMTYFKAQDRYASPYLSAYTALSFGWLKKAGYEIPEESEAKLQEYLLTFLRKNIQPNFYSNSMASTTRAVALSALSQEKKIGLGEIERYESHKNEMSLFGKSHFLQAALNTGANTKLVKESMEEILSFADESAGKFRFSEDLESTTLRILESPLRTNCAVLSAALLYREKLRPGAYLKDLPFKIVRYITQKRQGKSHWGNTQENIFLS